MQWLEIEIALPCKLFAWRSQKGSSKIISMTFRESSEGINSMVQRQEATPREAPIKREERNLGSESIGE